MKPAKGPDTGYGLPHLKTGDTFNNSSMLRKSLPQTSEPLRASCGEFKGTTTERLLDDLEISYK
jgi:hypothetical protein